MEHLLLRGALVVSQRRDQPLFVDELDKRLLLFGPSVKLKTVMVRGQSHQLDTSSWRFQLKKVVVENGVGNQRVVPRYVFGATKGRIQWLSVLLGLHRHPSGRGTSTCRQRYECSPLKSVIQGR